MFEIVRFEVDAVPVERTEVVAFVAESVLPVIAPEISDPIVARFE